LGRFGRLGGSRHLYKPRPSLPLLWIWLLSLLPVWLLLPVLSASLPLPTLRVLRPLPALRTLPALRPLPALRALSALVAVSPLHRAGWRRDQVRRFGGGPAGCHR